MTTALRVTPVKTKAWVHTAIERKLMREITTLAKKLAKPKHQVLSALVAKGLRTSKLKTVKKTKR